MLRTAAGTWRKTATSKPRAAGSRCALVKAIAFPSLRSGGQWLFLLAVGRCRPPIDNRKDHTLSHIVTIKTEVRDATAVRAACQRLGLPVPVQGKTRLFSGEVEGLAVQLPDWQ